MSSVRELILEGVSLLQDASSTPKLDSEVLLRHVLGWSETKLISENASPVDELASGTYLKLLKRRQKNEPVAYLTGNKEFYGRTFVVSRDVLIPRPETELLIDRALAFAEGKHGLRILDLGTGSGAIAVTLACELKQYEPEIVAVDISMKALSVASLNAEKQDVSDFISFVCSDWFSALNGKFDLIVSNPPYIAESDPDTSRELVFEPEGALYSGTDGLNSINSIVKELPLFLKPEGCFLCEFGSTQGRVLRNLFSNSWNLNIYQDLGGLDRVLELSA